MYKKIVISTMSFLIIVSNNLMSTEINVHEFANKNIMNGIKISDFKNFENKWKLVTVRYREDSKELRLTYANDLAYKTLIKNQTDYKDGSVFAKIAYLTKPDPHFVSSAIPSEARRFQFMVRNSKKYSTTHGWGYALFDTDGKTFPEDPVEKTNSCNACHELVPERAYVFSSPISTNYLEKALPTANAVYPRIHFKTLENEKVTGLKIKALINVKRVFVIDNKLADNIFQGALDEIKPTLIQKALVEKSTAALISKDNKRYVVVKLENDKCVTGESKFKITQTLIEKDESGDFKTFENYLCNK